MSVKLAILGILSIFIWCFTVNYLNISRNVSNLPIPDQLPVKPLVVVGLGFRNPKTLKSALRTQDNTDIILWTEESNVPVILAQLQRHGLFLSPQSQFQPTLENKIQFIDE
jgi:hypothetical protein